MPLQAGTRLGPYELVVALGAGGLGEGYKAADARLNRLSYFKGSPEPEVVRFIVSSVGQAGAMPVSISPDGRWIVGSKGGAAALGVDAVVLNAVTSQVLIAGNVVTQPFWSPD